MKRITHKKTVLALLIGASLNVSVNAQENTSTTKETADTDNIEVIQVTGLRGSNLRALNNKRYSATVVDGISSEELGKFPDQNVAESLQRITGISIDRSGGEGRFITVRGLGPEFNSVLYNGRILATENSGREFSFDILAAEAISGADAYKSSTSDLLTGGIGATVNLTTAKPMDTLGTQAAISAKSTYDTLAEDYSPQISGVYSYSNETFGALVSLNYVNRNYRIQEAAIDGWMERDFSYIPNKSGPGDFAHVMAPRNIDFRDDQGDRERIGGTVVIQARPNENVLLTADLLYSKFTVDSSVMTAASWTHDWVEGFDSAYVDENNTMLAYSYANDVAGLSSDFVQQAFNRPTETRQVGLNMEWFVNDALQVTADVSYSDAVNDAGGTGQFVIAGVPNANPRYDYTHGGDYGSLTYDNPMGADLMRSHSLYFSGQDVSDQITQYRLDGKYTLGYEFAEVVHFGIYGSSRTKDRQSYDNGTNGNVFSGYGFDVPDELFQSVDQSDFLSGGAPATWFTFDPFAYADYLWSESNIRENIINAGNGYADSIMLRRELGGPYARPNRNTIAKVSEDVFEAYARLDFNTEMFDMPLSGNVGLRYSKTDIEAAGYSALVTDIYPVVGDDTLLNLTLSDTMRLVEKNDYDYFLPSLNLKLDATDDQVIRFSATKSIARPTLTRMTPGMSGYSGRLNASTAYGGNPQLLPYESVNFDLAWNWYYGEASYVGVTAFHKRVDNFISSVTLPEVILEGNQYGEFLVTRERNAEAANIKGLELALLHTFDSGFGFQANYTFVDSDDDFDPTDNTNTFALEGLSDSYNLIGFYEKDDLQVRIAYNWRDEYLAQAVGGYSQPVMVEAYGQLDFTATYNVTENLSVFLDGTNVLDNEGRRFSIYEERLLNFNKSGARFSLGARYTF
ncbi:TonB-dependent receptor [Shewanella avicenniae]|uniref:TonB-dependent receptor n=1 Tax=Shewanella avicenniae TaxID=2814294 RepID=A0ABX7QNR8_9GAMM|nr:TonB-dependent receptor [Shewanella avicenniae]QSX32647.1 TonB-dependent receptor [Shewanella avicenniae]